MGAPRVHPHKHDANYPPQKIEELMNVKGIGEKSFLKIKPLISIAKPDKASGGD